MYVRLTVFFLRTLPVAIILGTLLGLIIGEFGYWFGIFIVLGLHPLMDQFFQDLKIEDTAQSLAWMKFQVYLYPIIQTALLFIGALRFSNESLANQIVIFLSTGLVTGGIGITLAHECVHRSQKIQRGIGLFLLSQVNYCHFRIEHIYGHHSRVGTMEDPATARLNEGLYQFVPRTIFMGLHSAWLFESKRTKKSPFYTHRFLHYFLFQSFWIGLFYLFFRLDGVIFFLLQSLIAIILLETVNYIEHYGLVRNTQANGKLNPVESKHSWDSSFTLTNMTLFNLGRHAHHHLSAHEDATKLKNDSSAQQLPVGYSLAILIAFIPPLWRRIIHPVMRP